MTLRDGVCLGLLAAALCAMSAWQNHTSSQRMAAAAVRFDAAGREAGAQPGFQRPPPRELTAEETQRLGVAHGQADEIIQSGRLTPADVERLSAQLDGIPWRQALDVRRRIADAINRQQLIPAELPFALP